MAEDAVLLTGFLPWGNLKRNHSGDVVQKYPDFIFVDIRRYAVDKLVLPVTLFGTEMAVERIQSRDYRAILHLGLNEKSEILHLERWAQNTMKNIPDTEDGPIVEGEGEGLEGYAFFDQIQYRLEKAGFEAHVSDDAGQFMCNYLYYHSLRLGLDIPTMFMHVPAKEHIRLEALSEAIHLVLAELIAQVEESGE